MYHVWHNKLIFEYKIVIWINKLFHRVIQNITVHHQVDLVEEERSPQCALQMTWTKSCMGCIKMFVIFLQTSCVLRRAWIGKLTEEIGMYLNLNKFLKFRIPFFRYRIITIMVYFLFSVFAEYMFLLVCWMFTDTSFFQ